MVSMRSLATAGLLLGLLPLAAACGGATATHSVTLHHTGTPELFRYAAGGRDLQTVVLGNPTAAPQGEFDRAVVAAMQGAPFGPETRFTTAPSARARPGYRVAMLFGDPSGLSGLRACRAADQAVSGTAETVPGVTDGGPLHLQAAFCYRERVLSEARVDAGDIASPQDPKLRSAVRQAVLALFPRRDPDRLPDHEILPDS